MKRKPTVLIAICQCGSTIGGLDYERTDRVEMGRLVGKWLHHGCTIEPRFEASQLIGILPCACDAKDAPAKPEAREGRS